MLSSVIRAGGGRMTKETVALITAVIALITTGLTLWKTIAQEQRQQTQQVQLVKQGASIEEQRNVLMRQQEELQKMRALAERMSVEMTIESPHNEQEVPAIFRLEERR